MPKDNTTQKTFLYIFLLLVIVGLSFLPSLNNGFTNWDDIHYVIENPLIQDLNWSTVHRVFTTSIFNTYSPLQMLSYAVERHYFDLNPFIYHLTNLILHGAVTLLVFYFMMLCGLTQRAAFLGAVIFGIHPMHVESVAWITERKDVLYGMFYMAALCVHMKYRAHPRIQTFVWVMVFGFLAILTKSMALSLPLILLLCDWIKERKITAKMLIEKIPHVLYIVPVAWITFSLNTEAVSNKTWEDLLVIIWNSMFYIRQFLIPEGLNPIYVLPRPIGLMTIAYGGSLVLLGLIGWLMYLCRKHKWFNVSILFYLFSMFFLFSFNKDVVLNIVADRFMYLPSIGFCLLGGYFLDQRFQKAEQKSVVFILITLLFVLLGLMTYQQCKVWKNSVTLWERAVKYNPNEVSGFINLAEAHYQAGSYNQMRYYLDRAIFIDPSRFEPYSNYGLYHLDKGSLDKALKYFEKSISLAPSNAAGYNNMGAIYQRKKEYARAEEYYKKASDLNPYDLVARLNLANIYRKQKKAAEAEQAYLEILTFNFYHLESIQALMELYFETGQMDKARQFSQKYLK